MSQENVELHRRTIETFNARDVEAFVALCEPQIEFHSTFAAVGGGVYHGHDGLRRWFRDFEDVWGDDFHIEPEVYFDLGEQTLLFYVLHGRGQQSGADVALPTAVVARWRDDGLCVYFKAYADREDALRGEASRRMPSNQSLLTADRSGGARRSRRLLTLRDTGRAMSQENVDTMARFANANNHRDVEAMLEEVDAEVEWHSAILGSLRGEAAVYCGHAGIRELFKDLYEAFSDFRIEFAEFRDLGDRVVGIGRWVTCGEESGLVSTHPLAVVVDLKNAKAFRVQAYLDPKEALEAAGLSE